MDVKKFSLAHGSIIETSSFDVLRKSSRFISDSDRLTFVVVTDDNEVWAIYPKATRLVFSMNEGSEVSAMCFLPSTSAEENCVAFALFDRTSGDSCLRIVDISTMSDCYSRVSAFPGRVTALASIDPSFKPNAWALAFGVENGAVGVFLFSESSYENYMVETLDKQHECHSPVSKLYWLKTRQLLVCGYESGYLTIVRLPSKVVVYGNSIEGLPISSIVSTEPENDPRLTCFVWVSCANGRRSSAAMVFRVEGENDNVICMGVHDLAANIPDADTEKAWAYLIDISYSKQPGSSNLVSFLWEIGVTGRSTDYYFALFDINAWFSWQSQANLQLKEPIFGGSKFLAVFKLPRSVNEDNRLLGAFAISSSVVSFRPRVSLVPLTSPLLYPCSLSFDVLCICADSITKVRYKSLQEILLKNCCSNSDFTRISETQLATFVERLTTLGLIDMFDGSSIGCSHHESVLNAFFKFANEGEAARFAKKVLQNENYVPVFRTWLFYRATAARKDLDTSLDLVFKKCEASEHLRAVESDIRLILRLTTCLPPSSASFGRDLKRILSIFLDLIAALLVFLKPDFRPVFSDALQMIPFEGNNEREMFRRRLKMPFSEAVYSRERFVNLLTSSQMANDRFDNLFLLLYTFFNVCPGDGIFTLSLVEMLDCEFQKSLGVPPKFVRFVAAACFLDRKFPAQIIRPCLRLSRPLEFTVEDQVTLLNHLAKVDIDAAYEVSLQFLMVYRSEKDAINWTSGAHFELFKLFLDVFSRKNYFEAPLQLCMLMPSEADRRGALVHFFKVACLSDEPHFSAFLRLLASSFSLSISTGVDPLQECIKFMCNSKQRLLLERACLFYAERGPSFLAEALAISNRANDLRFVSVVSSENDEEVNRLVEKRRQIVEDRLGKMPDYVRQRIVEKSRSDQMSWMFVPSSISSLPASDQTIETPKSDDENCIDSSFEWPEIEKLLVLAANSPLATVSTFGPRTSISFTGNRRSSVVSFSALQPRLSTAKKCRFVDSTSPTEEPPVASSTLIISDEMEIVQKEVPCEEKKEEPHLMPITPVVKTYPPPQEPKISDPSPILPVAPTEDENCILIESDSSEEEEEVAPEPPKVTPLAKKQRFVPTSVKEPSPAQKLARRIVQRSVRFSCSPNKVVSIPSEVEVVPAPEPPVVVKSFEPGPGDIVEILSSSEDEEVEKDSDEEDWDENGEEDDDNGGLFMEEEEEPYVGVEPVSEEEEESESSSDKMEEEPEIYLSPMVDSHGRPPSRERPPSFPPIIVEEVPTKPTTPEMPEEVPMEVAPAEEPVQVETCPTSLSRLIKSVGNISPNRLAAQMALRRSVRIVTMKRRQEMQAASSSLENKEPATTSEEKHESPSEDLMVPIVLVEKEVVEPAQPPAPSEVIPSEVVIEEKIEVDSNEVPIPQISEVKAPIEVKSDEVLVETVEVIPSEVQPSEVSKVPIVLVEKIAVEVEIVAPPPVELTVQVDDRRAPTPPVPSMVVDDKPSQNVDLEPPVRLTRSRSANSAIPTPSQSVADTSMSKRRRTRQTEAERLSPQSSVTSEPSGPALRTRGGARLRTVSGSSESGALPSVSKETVAVPKPIGRRRVQSASDAVEEAVIRVSPRKHLRKDAPTTSTTIPEIVVTTADSPSDIVTSLPPLPPTRKRAKSSNEDGMVTPSSSPKRPNLSASVSKIEPVPINQDEGGERRHQSAPTSPNRRTRRGSQEQDQAQHLAAALSKISDSPAYHTRQHSHSQTDDSATEASSTVSTASSSVRRTRSTTKNR